MGILTNTAQVINTALGLGINSLAAASSLSRTVRVAAEAAEDAAKNLAAAHRVQTTSDLVQLANDCNISTEELEKIKADISAHLA